MKITILAAALLFSATTGAFAQAPATPRVDRREANQQNRIGSGVASGQLTPRETARLEKREGKIQSDEAKAKSDGVVTAAERRKLAREQNRASRAIHRQKHDAQTN
jgi:hypothetical protein